MRDRPDSTWLQPTIDMDRTVSDPQEIDVACATHGAVRARGTRVDVAGAVEVVEGAMRVEYDVIDLNEYPCYARRLS